MSGNGKAVKAGIGYTIGNILIRGLSFLTLPIFTRLMSTADYGLYTTYVAYESIVTLVVGLGLYSSLKAAKIEFKEGLDKYVSTVSVLPIIFAAIIVVTILPFLNQVAEFVGFGGYLIVLMVAQALASSVLTMYNCRVSLDFAYKSYLAVAFASSFGNIGLSLVLILTVFRENSSLGRILGTCLPLIVIAIVLLAGFFKKARPKYDKEYIGFGLKYSLPLVPHGLSQVVLAQFGRIVVQRDIGNAAVGIYGFAYTVAIIPQILVSSLDNVWGPWFFEKYEAGEVEEIKTRSTQYIALFSTMTVGLFCLSPEIVKLMSAQEYWAAAEIVCPAILGVHFTFLYGLPAQIEYYLKKTNYIAIGTAAAALLNIGGCIALVPRFGYEAAVYVTVVTYALYFVAHMLIANMLTRGSLPFEMKWMWIYTLAVIAAFVFMQAFIDLWVVRYIGAAVWCIAVGFLNRHVISSFIARLNRKQIPTDDDE